MKTTRIYGFTEDFGSYAQVTRGFALGLTELGHTKETLEVVSLENRAFDEDEPKGLPLADVAILTGPPVAASALIEGVRHARRLVMVAPNSSRLPERTMYTVNSAATELLAPSLWAAGVLERYTTLPIIVVPHGVAPGFRPMRPLVDLEALYAEGSFRILHLSSTPNERKGTVELVRAFLVAMEKDRLPPASELRLVLAPGGKGKIMDFLSECERSPHLKQIVMMDRLGQNGADPASMAQIYSSVHLVCQPSRGEGFGMVPLEALASGCPIAATACTGHSEWFREDLPGAVKIATGEPAPIDDMIGAVAPGLLMSDVQDGIVRAYEDWHSLKAAALGNAATLSGLWSWPKQLASLVAMLEGT
jgi:glycosyltransferase involved in cell wall biosynthesis